MHPLLGCIVLLLAVAALIVLTAAAISWMKKDAKHGSGSLGNAVQNLESLFVESKKNVIEAQQHEESEKDDSSE